MCALYGGRALHPPQELFFEGGAEGAGQGGLAGHSVLDHTGREEPLPGLLVKRTVRNRRGFVPAAPGVRRWGSGVDSETGARLGVRRGAPVVVNVARRSGDRRRAKIFSCPCRRLAGAPHRWDASRSMTVIPRESGFREGQRP